MPAMLVSDLPPGFLRAAAFVFGALWGSFFNVAIYRWPLGMSVVRPPSHCPACGENVPAFRNLPIVAYLMQHGKASCCGAKMTPRYVLVEVLGGVLFLAIIERFVLGGIDGELMPRLIHALLLFAFVGGLLIATFIDLEHTIIPDEVSLPGAALGLASVGLRGMDPLDAAIGAGVGYLAIQILFVWGYEHLFGRRGMGEGDSKLLLMIGAFCGWKGVAFAVLGGSLQGVIMFAVVLLFKGDLRAHDEYADDRGPHCKNGPRKAGCQDKAFEFSRLLAKPAKVVLVPEETAPPPGLTLSRLLMIVLFFGGLSILSLMHIEDAEMSRLSASMLSTMGMGLLAIYWLAGRRAAAEEEEADKRAKAAKKAAKDGGIPEPTVDSGLSLPKVAFGPYLALGAVEWLFFGEDLFDWWIGLF